MTVPATLPTSEHPEGFRRPRRSHRVCHRMLTLQEAPRSTARDGPVQFSSRSSITDASFRAICGTPKSSPSAAQRHPRTCSKVPGIHLVELDSPGGYAIEGLGLAKVLEARRVDMLVLHRCASACIAAFAAGERRIFHWTILSSFNASNSTATSPAVVFASTVPPS